MIMIMIMIMSAKISTDELRFNFQKVLEAMSKGRGLILTYRNKPLARIEPILPEPSIATEEDPFLLLANFAEPMGSLTSREIDEELYA